MDKEAVAIVKRAFSENNVELLLLGKQGYSYMPKWSPAPGSTDLTAVLSVIYDTPLGYSNEEIVDKILYGLNRIISSYEGLFPAATIILIESLRLKQGRPILGLPLNEIATVLRQSIIEFKSKLITDKIGPGNQWEDGMFGELHRISNNIIDLGGPYIFPQ